MCGRHEARVGNTTLDGKLPPIIRHVWGTVWGIDSSDKKKALNLVPLVL